MSGVSNRDAAFLAEMGVGPLWTLRGAAAAGGDPGQAVAAAEAEAEAPAAVVTAPPPALAPAPVSAESAWGGEPETEITDEQIAGLGWNELSVAITNCTRCGLCKDGRKPVFGSGARKARWLVAAGASTAADEAARQPLAGDPGKLLVNMLAAVELSREAEVYVTNLVKCRPATASGGERAPTQDEVAACRPFLERELALTGARVVLTLGQIAANGLLGKPLHEPLSGTRGKLHASGSLPLVATAHPGELLRRGGDKALAWADLCMARTADAGPG